MFSIQHTWPDLLQYTGRDNADLNIWLMWFSLLIKALYCKCFNSCILKKNKEDMGRGEISFLLSVTLLKMLH